MKKRIPARSFALCAVFGILLCTAILFLLGAGEAISQRVIIFAIVLLLTGLINLMSASTQPAGKETPEWPMIQGLLDVLMAIMLFMSSGTRLTTLLLILMAIWALMGALARLLSALKLKNGLRRHTWVQTGFMLLGGALFLLGGLVEAIDPALSIGAALTLCALGSFSLPTRH